MHGCYPDRRIDTDAERIGDAERIAECIGRVRLVPGGFMVLFAEVRARIADVWTCIHYF